MLYIRGEKRRWSYYRIEGDMIGWICRHLGLCDVEKIRASEWIKIVDCQVPWN